MDQSEYLVVVNEEDQHALWPAHQGVPAGWQQRYSGSRDACLSYVEDAWPDNCHVLCARISSENGLAASDGVVMA